MKLYDSIIEETLGALKKGSPMRFSYEKEKPWPCLENTEFIMQRDAGPELGGSGEPSVNYTCVTTSWIVDEDEIIVYGQDIPEIKKDTAFARIVILETCDLKESEDQEKTFQTIRNMEFVRYHVFPEGYMVRVSASSNQEQVRIAKSAFKKGICFSKVGAAYIKKYKELPEVKKVRVIFVTEKELVDAIKANAEKVDAITKTLTHILDGMPTDCGHCSMKPVCDEVDGLKELHLGKKAAK